MYFRMYFMVLIHELKMKLSYIHQNFDECTNNVYFMDYT